MKRNKTRELVQIAIAVAAIIVGGYGILVLSAPFALPGIKFIMMAPYLSMIMMILLQRIEDPYMILKINAVFALIMMSINLFMGLSIALSGLSTQILQKLLGVKTSFKMKLIASAYSAFVVLTALPISKYFIGGAVFEAIENRWIVIAACLAFFVGFVGSLVGIFINKRIARIY